MQNSEHSVGVNVWHDPESVDTAKILIVDDRAENLLVSTSILEELGHEILTAKSGEQALKCLLENEVAVILLDVNMPGMDGLETTRYIRMREKNKHTPIIFITAYVEEMHTKQGYSLGAVDYILSPVVPHILRTKVGVFAQLYLMNRAVERQAQQRVALEIERAARAGAEQMVLRSTFLAEASHVLNGSLDLHTTMQALAKLIVPKLADFCALYLIDESKRTRQLVIGLPPANDDDSHGRGLSASSLDNPVIGRLLNDIKSGKRVSTVCACDPEESVFRVSGVCSEGGNSIETELNLHALCAIPLIARGYTNGALVLGFSNTTRTFDTSVVGLADEVALRAALSLDNCQLFATVQDADRRKNEFLAMLAHELRNPLASVRNAVHILTAADLAPDRLTWGVDVIDRQSKQLVSIVHDLLDVARITQGKIDLKLEPVNVEEIVKLAVEMNRELLERHQQRLNVTVADSDLFVHGDHARVAQVLCNLINNAVKYSKPSSEIHVSAEVVNDDVLFRIQDHGAGIPAEKLDTIFDLFTQIHPSLDRSHGGLGIGLTIVQRLVKLHGGSISAHSAGIDRGTEFKVRLPRSRKPSRSVPVAKASAEKFIHRVLVVDDNIDGAETMGSLLEMGGHQVRIAHDGESAIELARKFHPQVVLLDIGLPRMNGYDVARALRALPATAQCFIFAVSGYGQPADLARSKEAGFDRHFVKPVDVIALEDILAKLKSKDIGGESVVAT